MDVTLLSKDHDKEEWLCSSNDAIMLGLDDGNGNIKEFSPYFTYPFFGMEENIYGFKDLKILIYFSSCLRVYISISFSKKIDKVCVKTHLLTPLLEKMFPDEAFETLEGVLWTSSLDIFNEWCRTPLYGVCNTFGEKMHEFSSGDLNISIYRANCEDSNFQKFYNSLQIFLLFFIEGATFIDIFDECWDIFLLLKGNQPVGFCTFYGFFHFPDKTRIRLSQFLILPPYERMGIGLSFYTFLYNFYSSNVNVVDVCVEEPNVSGMFYLGIL